VQAMLDDLRVNARRTSFLLLGVLAILFVYISYIQLVESEFLSTNALNRRSIEAAAQIKRGSIVDRNGKVLAFSERGQDDRYERRYPYGPILANIIGYTDIKYGTTGIENSYNGELSGVINPLHFFGPIANLWTAKTGNNVIMTIDTNLEEVAYKALGNRRGAVVALDPKSGAVLAMVSKPGFDPKTLDRDWVTIATDKESRLMNRAVQGLYPPGSTLKVMIAEAALAEKITDTKKTFVCEGSLKIGSDYELTEAHHHAHGKVDLKEALAVSCNITFGTLALELGRDRMAETFTRYGFDRLSGVDLVEMPSRLPDFGHLGDGDLAQTGIGQGSLLVTPLKMAMLAAVFANKGVMMTPYLVGKITDTDGAIIQEVSSKEFLKPTSQELAQTVGKMMVAVVNDGTGSAAGLKGIQVAGKTGTAENPHGASHAWFIGFAPANDPKIAVAVIIENAGAGGEEAAPVAREIFARALR